MTNETARYLDLYDIAEHTGLALETIRKYHKTATQRRKAGQTRPADFPAPDVIIGSRAQWASPGWKLATIETWLTNRPRAVRRTRISDA